MFTEFVELRTLRLDRGWTYRRLVDEVNKVSPSQVSLSCLHGLLNDPKATPTELTLDGIRKYLRSVKRSAKRRRRPEKIPA